MNLDSALQTFIAEARELLQDMEAALLRLENEAADSETINAIFRAAHTIKGSAGLFGLDAVVAFTHVVESVLDKVRADELQLDADLAGLFLDSCDQIAALVEQVAGAGGDEALLAERSAVLIARLDLHLDGPPAHAAPPAPLLQPAAVACAGAAAGSDNWHISLRFGADVLRNGMDPLSFIRYLKTLGEVVSIVTLDMLPEFEAMDPESCYLGFEIGFRSDADKATIEGVFEFVRDDARIHILPPRSSIHAYIEMIRALPEEEMRLGELLVSCGTLTEAELRDGLAAQSGADAGAPIGEILVDAGSVQPAVVEAALQKQQQVKEAKIRQQKFIRVDADKLDELINLVGELVIAGAGASVVAGRSGLAEMLEATANIGQLIEEVRDSALSLRMVQIGETFSRFQRVVRDISRELGKDIALEITGADTELDKTVVEKIGDPLMHLVRNSMDHGIEKADVRIARGKPAQGTIHLNAYHDSGSIVIEVGDDGGGLNRERILAKGIDKGLVAPGQHLSDEEIYSLIFAAGFSTADQITNLSGRGVGMDVVRKNIEALRGSIGIESVPEQGSTMRIRLPLTLAIIDGFMVGVHNAAFVIPLEAVVECIELGPDADQPQAEANYINLRGEVLPYMRLRELFEIGGSAPARENIVVVQHAGRKAGIAVDALMGEFQTVIKPLGRMFSHIRGIGGSTILGTGEVALILDVQGLIEQVSQRQPQPVALAGR
jgi:two-component system chemotaxis sensor kinase CheA